MSVHDKVKLIRQELERLHLADDINVQVLPNDPEGIIVLSDIQLCECGLADKVLACLQQLSPTIDYYDLWDKLPTSPTPQREDYGAAWEGEAGQTVSGKHLIGSYRSNAGRRYCFYPVDYDGAEWDYSNTYVLFSEALHNANLWEAKQHANCI